MCIYLQSVVNMTLKARDAMINYTALCISNNTYKLQNVIWKMHSDLTPLLREYIYAFDKDIYYIIYVHTLQLVYSKTMYINKNNAY